jgi:phosphoglycolate phosphatase
MLTGTIPAGAGSRPYGEDLRDLRRWTIPADAGSSEPPAAAVVIGDTPADVEGGLRTGVRVIAVATGRSSEVELTAAGAAEVLPGLRDTVLAVKSVLRQDI